MAVRIVRNRDLVRRPWKNGGGTTAEVAVSPPHGGFDDFDWRISMADVSTDGPFSTFPGIDRTLALIEGEAVDLDIDGVAHRLDPETPLVSFPGEAVTSARLSAGPIRDLNVMTRRARFTHRMRVAGPGEWPASVVPGAVLGLVALEDATDVRLGGEIYQIDRLDVLIADGTPQALFTDRAMLVLHITRR